MLPALGTTVAVKLTPWPKTALGGGLNIVFVPILLTI
jgi:hypothetical protein